MTRKTILVVDDDAATRQAYVEFLTECGYDVQEAAHGGEAIMHVYRRRPDLVLLDITMPVLDGVETAQSLRERSSTANLRILGVTGSESALKRERMLELCDDVLMKPCAPEVVASHIRSLVQKAA
ncbi:MAG TPA: response regulator [Longimicrobium sp.]|jgi:CheY-like chemotaxis protein|nr:response regulator [Longimicrobium sp.]